VTLDGLVFNEVAGQDGDYFELTNIGDAPLQMGRYRIIDGNGGGPKADGHVVLPEGYTLDPGAYLVVFANLDLSALPGERTECGPGGPPTCFHAAWGVSWTNGDSLFVLSPDQDIALELTYPLMVVGAGESWGRMPDGTGEFAATARTPGAPNESPPAATP